MKVLQNTLRSMRAAVLAVHENHEQLIHSVTEQVSVALAALSIPGSATPS